MGRERSFRTVKSQELVIYCSFGPCKTFFSMEGLV